MRNESAGNWKEYDKELKLDESRLSILIKKIVLSTFQVCPCSAIELSKKFIFFKSSLRKFQKLCQ